MLRGKPQSMHAPLQAGQRSFAGDAIWIAKMFQVKGAEKFAFVGNHLHQT